MSRSEPGKRFEKWLKASMDAAGMFSMRIPDKVFNVGGRIASEQTPADFYACHGGERLHAYLIEAKACSGHRIPFDRLQGHQEKALSDFDAIHEDAHGYVAVNFYDSVNLRELNVCYMVPIGVWVEYKGGKMKSLSHEECARDDRILLCPRVKGAIFDMRRIIEKEGK